MHLLLIGRSLPHLLGLSRALLRIESAQLGTPRRLCLATFAWCHQGRSHLRCDALHRNVFVAQLGAVFIDVGPNHLAELGDEAIAQLLGQHVGFGDAPAELDPGARSVGVLATGTARRGEAPVKFGVGYHQSGVDFDRHRSSVPRGAPRVAPDSEPRAAHVRTDRYGRVVNPSNPHIVVLVGSLRSTSVSRAIARAVERTAPSGSKIELFELHAVPLYNGDIEAAGRPEPVEALNAAVAAADGLLICSPEYNLSFPAVTKNAIDWLSRPPRAWTDTALSLVVTTPGPRAGLSLRTHFDTIMARQPVRLFESMGIGDYGTKLDADGELTDPETVALLTHFLARFAAFCGHRT